MKYEEFIQTKILRPASFGFAPERIPEHLFDFQKACVEFAIRRGRAGLYLDTGLGKTRCQLEWARQCANEGNGYALILTPLAVAKQIEKEGRQLGYDVHVIRGNEDIKAGINICNYERLENLDVDAFCAVSLDESSILKSMASKIRMKIMRAFSGHRFRLSATATPAPNDHMEIGNQADFLGVMSTSEMLQRWFINDTGSASHKWRLKGHAERDFWEWMASWSRMASSPEDLGFDGSMFRLPPLKIHKHHVSDNGANAGDGLFASDVSATDMHKVKRETARARSEVVANLVSDGDTWIVWCDTNAEADILKSLIPDAVEVRGNMPIDKKEELLNAFSDGDARVIITKPSIAGFGLNWQHCNKMAFTGRTFSYEIWYQAVRRSWRFGQKEPVHVHLVMATGEDQIARVIERKEKDHETMKAEMTKAMRRAVMSDARIKVDYDPKHEGRLPKWL